MRCSAALPGRAACIETGNAALFLHTGRCSLPVQGAFGAREGETQMPNQTGINAVLVHTALAAALLMAWSAQAQDQGTADNGQAAPPATAAARQGNTNKAKTTTNLQEVVVTGTHRAGLSPTESISPIDAFSGSQIANQPSADLTESLTNIVPSLTTQRFPIADGTSFVRPVSLRNLSPDQTLVLVDGVRFHRSALVNLQLDPLGTFN